MPENDFGDVIECNTYLEAILHLSMLFGMAEALTIPERLKVKSTPNWGKIYTKIGVDF